MADEVSSVCKMDDNFAAADKDLGRKQFESIGEVHLKVFTERPRLG